MSILIGVIFIIIGLIIIIITYRTRKQEVLIHRNIQGYGTGILFILSGILNFIYKLWP